MRNTASQQRPESRAWAHEDRIYRPWPNGRRYGGQPLKGGHEVAVYNRTHGKTAALAKLGARACATVAEVCSGEAVFSMLANDEAVESVVFEGDGILASLAKGATHISS